MTPRNLPVLSTTPLTSKRPRRATKLPERYRPGDSSYASSPHTPSTSSPAPPTDSPVVAQGTGWYTILQPLRPGEKPETLRQAQIRQGLPLKGALPIIRQGPGWVVQLEPAPDKTSPENQKKAVTPSRQRIQKDMVDKRPRQQNHQVAAKTYRGADTGDAMEVEMDQDDGDGAAGVEEEQHDGVNDLEGETAERDGADALNERHESADPMDLEMASDDGLIDTRASSPLSEPMSDDALEDLLKTPAEGSETSSEELPPHPAFTGQEIVLGEFKYLARHLRNNDALDVLNEVEPDFTRHQPPTLLALNTPPPTSPPPALFSTAAALPLAGSPPSTSRPASLRPASLQPASSPPRVSPMDSPQAPSPSTITPPPASPHATTSPPPVPQPTSARMALRRTPSPSPSPAPMPSSPGPHPLLPTISSPPPPPPPPSPPPNLPPTTSFPPPSLNPSPSPSPSPSQPTLSAPRQHQHQDSPIWSDWIALWDGTSYVPDHVRDLLDTIPEDGAYYDVPAGQIQTVNAVCNDFGDPERGRRAREANFVVPGVEGGFWRTRARG